MCSHDADARRDRLARPSAAPWRRARPRRIRPASSSSCPTTSCCAVRAAASSCSSKRAPAARTSASAPPTSTFPRPIPVSRRGRAGVVTAVGTAAPFITARPASAACPRWWRWSARVAVPAHVPQPRVPVLTKVGCNSGPCHGALAGKNGFKLTLRGYDPEADYLTLTRQAGARRVNRWSPAKPDAAEADARRVARRRQAIRDGSAEYRVLRNGLPPAFPRRPSPTR